MIAVPWLMRACARASIEEMVMTPLRQRMLDALILRGMALRTQEPCIDAAARLARHCKRSPDALSPPCQYDLRHLPPRDQ